MSPVPNRERPVVVREARAEDLGFLASMRYDFRAEMDEPNESRDAFEARIAGWLRDHLGETWKAWLAFDGSEAIGEVLLQVVGKVPNPVPEPEELGYVTSLYVRPEHRGHGVGAALLDAALEHCRARGVDTIVLWPSVRSRSLYERRGFRAPGMVMELPLVEHPGRSRG